MGLPFSVVTNLWRRFLSAERAPQLKATVLAATKCYAMRDIDGYSSS